MELSRKLTSSNSQRLPPPALFQGPPSHNASNISLAIPPPASGLATPSGSQPPPLNRNRSPLGAASENSEKSSLLSPFISRRPSKNDVDGSDAIWQEMQTALSEVELSAVTSENVFGAKHSEALEDLRMKQLKLAQAWARSEAGDEVVDPAQRGADGAGGKTGPGRRGAADVKSQSDSATEHSVSRGSGLHRTLDEETEKDIHLARKRREANDRYFARVNQGVLDVVAKLEDVAQAMRTVEQESKDIWSDTESVATTAPSTNEND
ncbi:hypothetical protein N7535_003342 [Penicillium sp. DV-2018c]|nr:hypothetical protein N7461_000963 [Penicillium sp. DV-2018c]KAJ5576416.1 hypothetical protein N7535_003342 [Penicillium sp. DV-2018c]